MNMTEGKAAHLYASSWSKLDFTDFFAALSPECHYSSQYVMDELDSKDRIVEYLSAKVETIKKSGHRVDARESVLTKGADLSSTPGKAAVAMFQGESDEIAAVVLFTVEGDSISRFDLCMPELYKVQLLDQ